MGKQGAELRWWDQSSSSTVLLDPAALVESCKQQIQGKDGIPAEHQRLIFACRVDSQEVLSYTCKRTSRCPRAEECAASEFLEELRSWEAILKDDNHAIAKLLHPLVAAEEQVAVEDEKIASRLSCQMARELRSMGIPCNVYYLFFDMWIPTSLKNGKCCKATSNLNIQIDKDFQTRSFEILLFGRLNGSNLPLPFIYRMSGGEVAAQVSMQEQMVQYRQGQKTRHQLGLSTQSAGMGVECRDVCAVVENDRPVTGCHRSKHFDDYYCPCGKDLEFTVIISNDRQLKCFVLTVIQVPANASRKPEQLASHVHGRCERGNPGSQNDSTSYCVSSSGATSHNCESTLCESKMAVSQSLATTSCQLAEQTSPPQKGREPLAACSSSVSAPRASLKSPTNDCNAVPERASGNLTEVGVEKLPIVEEPTGKLAKKKKKRKGKRNVRLTRENDASTSSVDVGSLPTLSTGNGALDLRTWPAVVDRGCEQFDTTNSFGADKIDAGVQESPQLEESDRELFVGDDKNKGRPGNIFHCTCQCSGNREEGGGGSIMLSEPVTMRRGPLSAESSYLEVLSDTQLEQEVCALNKETAKGPGMNTVLKRGEGDIPVGRDIPPSACPRAGYFEVSKEFRDRHALSSSPERVYMSTASVSETSISQPTVGPMLVGMVFQDSLPPASSTSEGECSHCPLREAVGNLETCSDAKEHLRFSDTNVSARGGYNSSGAGSRNGRSGADGSGNRSHGQGSEDRKGTSGYPGGGQGSSGSNHGSSTGGSGGGSGGGNGNRGGGRGSSGGAWDGRRVDDDGGNGSKEGDNDERHRNSFQAGSNGEADTLQRKKGVSISSLDHCGRKGGSGSVAGGQLMNGTGGSHGSLATASGSGKENINSWHKVQKTSAEDHMNNPDELTEGSVPPSHSATGSDEGTPRNLADPKFCLPSAHMNGFLPHEYPPKKESHLTENREVVDNHHPHVRGHLTRDSFVNVLKQSIAPYSHDSPDAHLSSSSSRGGKDNQSPGIVPAHDSLKGAWQKKISWDECQQTAYSKQGLQATSHVGPGKGKLFVRPARNGTQIRGQLPDTEVISQTRSMSAPSTPLSMPNGSQDNFCNSREFSNNNPTMRSEGNVCQSIVPGIMMASEQAPQARGQAVNVVAFRQPGEGRPATEEASQRLTTWKSRRPVGEQERPVVRDKTVGDRERTTHCTQKWVPVEHKNGGSVKGSLARPKSPGNVPTGVSADDNIIEHNESQQNFVSSKQMASSDNESRIDKGLSSSSMSKSLRRIQTFPTGNTHAMSRIPGSEAEAVEPRESAASVANERPSGHVEQANLRGLLPRERTMDNPSSQATPQSTVSEFSESAMSFIPGDQETQATADDHDDSNFIVQPVLSPAEEETRRVAKAVLDAVHVSCRDRKAAEGIECEVGHPMAEFEKVLAAVAPSFLPTAGSSLPTRRLNELDGPCVSGRGGTARSRECSTISQICKDYDCSMCRCEVSDIPLTAIWHWYEEPSYYGAEVRAVDSQRLQKNGEEEEPFLAYFVPYLSGLQLFGSSSSEDSRSLGGLVGTKGQTNPPLNSQSKQFSANDVLATLFPPGKPDGASDERESTFRNRDTLGIQLLYEFYDADLPQVRRPLFMKVKELLEGVSSFNSCSRGDPAVLGRLCLGDVHPASWFAVAWYPIYRIPEGPLRAVFLTFHSFDHFAPRSCLPCQMGGATCIDDSISLPVVGVECYNLQGEPWLSMGGRFSKEASKVSERLSVNPSQCLENRINSLQEVAAVMAKGIPDENSATSPDGRSSSSKFKHSDYEFFVRRRR